MTINTDLMYSFRGSSLGSTEPAFDNMYKRIQGRIQRRRGKVRMNPFDNKFLFHGKFWTHYINLGYSILNVHTPYLLLYINKSILLSVNKCKMAGWVANSVDPDQTLRVVASYRGATQFAHACLSEYME